MINYDILLGNKRRVISVIDSCNTVPQLKVAEQYKINFLKHICKPMLNSYDTWSKKHREYYAMIVDIESTLSNFIIVKRIQLKNR